MESFGIYGNEERMAPLFALPSGQGRELKSWDYKQRQPLVLYFVTGRESEFLVSLAHQYAAYSQQGIEVLVITALTRTEVESFTVELNLPYPLLADPDYRVHSRYIKLTYPQYDPAQVKSKPAAVFVLDRYGSIFNYATAASVVKLPQQANILSSHEFISCLCNP